MPCQLAIVKEKKKIHIELEPNDRAAKEQYLQECGLIQWGSLQFRKLIPREPKRTIESTRQHVKIPAPEFWNYDNYL